MLVERSNGFKKDMEDTRFLITEPFDVTSENTQNYSAGRTWLALTPIWSVLSVFAPMTSPIWPN